MRTLHEIVEEAHARKEGAEGALARWCDALLDDGADPGERSGYLNALGWVSAFQTVVRRWDDRPFVLGFITEALATHRTDVIGREDLGPYLDRTVLFENALGSLVLHQFHRDDADPPHDHSFDFVSLRLLGTYREERWAPGALDPGAVEEFGPGELLFREAETVHRVMMVPSEERATSLVLRGPKRRPWGFWPSRAEAAANGMEFLRDRAEREACPWKVWVGVADDDGDVIERNHFGDPLTGDHMVDGPGVRV